MNTLVYIAGFIAVVSLSVGYAAAQAKSCTNVGNTDVQSIKCNDVEMMKTKNLCQLKKGRNATLALRFKPVEDQKSLKAVCHGILGPVPVPFPLPDSNGCHGMNPACPLKANNVVTYTTAIPVEHQYPSLKLIIKWELQSPDGKDVLCVLIPAQITG